MNRQVPNKNVKRYTIVGNGKVSKHFCQYFSLIGVDYNSWSRDESISNLKSKILTTDIVLLLISDSAIEQFVEENSFLYNKLLVHFSGTLSLNKIFGCHPLMTFSQQLYDLDVYESIPFICDNNVDFKDLFPQLVNNRWFNINHNSKIFYHAMCVMAGNFTQTLMRETSNELSNSINLPKDILFPYLLQNTINFTLNPQNSVTGPLQRGDFTTVKKHLHELQFHPLGKIYQSFVRLNTIQTSKHKDVIPASSNYALKSLEVTK